MSERTLTKAHIVDAIYKKTGHSHMESKDLVEFVLTQVKRAIKKDNAMLVSGFGKFEAYAKKARRGRNPQTGVSVTLPPRKVVVFRLSRKFRAELNPGE